MHLAFDGPRADRAPAHEVREELPESRVEEFRARRQSKIGNVGKEPACEPQPFVDVIGAVEIGIVDEALPAHDGPRLFEIHAHDHEDAIANVVRERPQGLRVVDRRLGVMDRARTDDGQQPCVAALENGFDRTSRTRYALASTRRDRDLLRQNRRGEQRSDAADSQVVGLHGKSLIAATPPHRGGRMSSELRER